MDGVGGIWLAERFDCTPVQRLRYESRIGGARALRVIGNRTEATYPEAYRPEAAAWAHLEFLLKHERVHLEFLARLFARMGPDPLTQWLADNPGGIYARKAGFLYEWLTGERLDVPDRKSGPYRTILGDGYLAATTPKKNERWRLMDDLPGTREFCPLVVLTDLVRDALAFDVTNAWQEMDAEFGADLLARSAVWLTIKESRASFAIEGESDQEDRVSRFARVIETETARHEDVFSEATLTHLQNVILGEQALRSGVRKSPIFIGETFTDVVHYAGPPWEEIEGMLDGIARFARSTRGGSSLLRAAALSFGFVYIHPMKDGNGRISRFLINDTLRRDGVVPEPFVVPVSAVIRSSRREYDRVLETFSRPFIARYGARAKIGRRVVYPDGTTSDFHFDAQEDALPVWRYPDLTEHAVYTAEVVRKTIQEEMRNEARTIRSYRGAREAVKEIVEGPDRDLDRIVRSVRETGGRVSNALRKEFPLLADETLAARIAAAVDLAFADVPRPDSSFTPDHGGVDDRE